MWGVGTGVVGSMMAMTLRTPAAAAAAGGLKSAMYEIVPLTTGAAILYTVGSAVGKDIQGKKDWKSEFFGGALAGMLVQGVKRRSFNASFVGALLFGTAAAAVQWAIALEGNAKVGRENNLHKHAYTTTPTDFGKAASASANFERRLQ